MTRVYAGQPDGTRGDGEVIVSGPGLPWRRGRLVRWSECA
jgi:hypothetical protein